LYDLEKPVYQLFSGVDVMHSLARFRATCPALLVLLIFFLTDVSMAQEGKDRLCPKCDSTGKIENPFMTEEMKALEKEVVFCSYVIEQDKEGHGIEWFPCERCRNPELEKKARGEFEALKKERVRWLERFRETDELLKPRRKLIHLETEHFVIAWNIPKIKTADKKTYNCHEALHLYAKRMEEFYADFLKFLGLEEKEMRNHKHFLYLFESQKTLRKAAHEYTGLDCWNAAKLPGNPSILCCWMDKINLKTDDHFHRHLIHHLSHLLNVAYYRMEWLAMKAGWADEGLAHFFEIKYFGIADNTCDEEGEEEEYSSTDWEVDVRKALETGKAPSFADISLKTTTALQGDEHKFAWSYVDFLLKRNPHKFKLFMKAIKEKRTATEGLKEAYSLNFISFSTQWEEYVLENYRKKPLKVKARRRRVWQ